ncbi:MAG: ATP-dependent DNA helicase RecG [Treponema sp.]|jgi:ATP-dependent DNA helicase RecG|nr:ATP-dependent DNA helicase RecG [Treponema sp.]
MFLRELIDPIEKIKGAGPASSRILAAAGITGVGQLLSRYPRDYEDRSRAIPLRDWRKGPVCTTARVIAHDWFGFGTMRTLKVYIEDSGDRACLVCFNRPFLQKTLPVGERVRVWGRFYYKYGELQASAFETDAEGGKKFGAILPVYPLSAGLNQALLRKLTKNALEQYGSAIDDEVPAPAAESEALLRKGEAITIIHYPPSREALEKARNTLIYEELFYLETLVGRRALERRGMAARKLPSSPAAAGTLSALQRRLVERLPFDLTAGQTGALAEINADLAASSPMARLLQGDVGSGKTLVAFLAALAVIEGGGQAALMAPTELLARQHAENAARLLEPLGIRPAYLTGNLKAAGRRELLKALAAGEIDLALGTHALFSPGVNYRALRMAIIDEQHRFGVIQRHKILAKGKDTRGGPLIPHLLMMSATPIPRTLALTVFGDLDVSVIGDMPGGRMPVETHLAKDSNAQKVYDFVRKQLDAGRQAYFVYPLIGDDGENLEADLREKDERTLKDAVTMSEKLAREIFPNHHSALLHSRVDDETKRRVMEQFRSGAVSVLAATSVVEVGVDVPNANCMVIHHAERFGLSALHQLRGRVGRGGGKAYCFLIYSEPEGGLGKDALDRLKAIKQNSSGFVIAEEDLKIRGPGLIAGIEQSGYLRLGIADPVRDCDILLRARSAAFAMLEKDPGLLFAEHRRVAEVLERAPPFTEYGIVTTA